MESNLSRLAINASFWSGADAAGRAVVGFAITLILARLVSPGEFGIVAIVLVFSAIANVLVDSGLGLTLIQQRDTTHESESAAFFFNVAASIAVALTMMLAAPLIAAFFGEPVLVKVIPVMAVNVVVSALGAIHSTLLTKALDFKPLFVIGLSSALLSGALAVGLAWLGYGLWSLVWQVTAQTTITTLLLWARHPWRPLRRLDRNALQRLLVSGSHLMGARLLDTLYLRLYSVFVGKIFDPAALGFYSRAQDTQQLPTNLLTNILNRVALPAFSHAASDAKRLAAALAKSTRLLMFLNLPAMLGMALTARPLVFALFGARWAPVVPLLQILCIVGALWPMQVLNLSALVAQGHARLFFRIEVLKKAIGVAALLAAIPYGLHAIAWSQALAATIAFFINTHYTSRFLSMGALAQLSALRKPGIASLTMALAVLVIRPFVDLRPLPTLLLLSAVGGVVYLATCRLLRDHSLQEIIVLLRKPRGPFLPSTSA